MSKLIDDYLEMIEQNLSAKQLKQSAKQLKKAGKVGKKQVEARLADADAGDLGRILLGVGGALLLGTAAYLVTKANRYDPATGRYRAADGTFRSSRFS